MMEQLAASEKMASVGQMAAGVAHEINTPLGVILGYAQLMMDDFSAESEPGQNLAIIERQTKACRKIVADLLKFSRQSESAREDVSINEILMDVIAVTQHSLNMDHITVHQDFTPDLSLIVGDTERLRQVFVNLVNNAHHAMEQQGSGDLTMISRYDSITHEVVATVQDTGHGILGGGLDSCCRIVRADVGLKVIFRLFYGRAPPGFEVAHQTPPVNSARTMATVMARSMGRMRTARICLFVAPCTWRSPRNLYTATDRKSVV